MPPESGSALIVAVVAVLPGFVTLLINERTHTIPRVVTSFERLMQALYYSALTWVIIVVAAWFCGKDRSELIHIYKHEESLGKLTGAALIALLVVPIAIAYCSYAWRRSKKLRPWALDFLNIDSSHTTPTAWDFFYQQRVPCLVRVTLSDGRVVGGLYAQSSFAGYGEQSRDLYLEQRWILDEDKWFIKPAKDSRGLWLSKDSIVSFELYDGPHELTKPETQPTEAADPASAPERS